MLLLLLLIDQACYRVILYSYYRIIYACIYNSLASCLGLLVCLERLAEIDLYKVYAVYVLKYIYTHMHAHGHHGVHECASVRESENYCQPIRILLVARIRQRISTVHIECMYVV